MDRPNERGIAILVAMFMVLILSLLASSLMFVSRTETFSSLSYQTMSQTRYAAEAGLHSAANHILWTYATPGTGADPIANYDMTVTPVRYNGADVVLSSNPSVASNYPVAAVRAAFAAATQGTLAVGNGTVGYTATAKLMYMRQFTDSITGNLVALQTWEITGVGSAGGIGASQLEVAATIERQETPIFAYAAFASSSGCNALQFGGNSHTDSYDSSTYGGSGAPTLSGYGGNVGTNGNFDGFGSSEIDGSLSTPRTGVGACSASNVTASDDLSSVHEGLIQLSQPVDYPTPPDPNPLPPTTTDSFTKNGGCPAGASYCTVSANGATITPPTPSTVVTLGNVSMGSQAQIHLGPGVYVVNSISMGAQANIIVDGGGPVIIKVAGQGTTTPIDFTGGSLANTSMDPAKLQFIYGGTGTIEMTGGSANAAAVYAPRAAVSFKGNADFYGAIVASTFANPGNAGIHYDRNLSNGGQTVGNPLMASFTWKNY